MTRTAVRDVGPGERVGRRADLDERVGRRADLDERVGRRADLDERVGRRADLDERVGRRADLDERVGRRAYLDWMRGVAVLVMIEAHVIDSWTRAADRGSPAFGRSLVLGGFGAPLFLLLAGVAVALSAESKARRLGASAPVARAVERRGLEIFLLAFLFRVQAWLISRSAPGALLKVDILNIMGPSIVATAALWGACRTFRGRLAACAGATAAIVFATPIVRATPLLNALPDFLEAYLRPVPGLTNFAVFPWAAFVPAGACLGLLIDRARTQEEEARLNWWFACGGAALAIAAYAASYLPSPYRRSDFWTSSPAFFLLRTGIMTTAIGLAYAWTRRPSAGVRWSPLIVMGRSSLFIYWIHVEMVYGVFSTPLHGALSIRAAWGGLFAFCLFMLACAVVKERVVAWWRGDGGAGRK